MLSLGHEKSPGDCSTGLMICGMETVLAVGGMVCGLMLKALFQTKFLGWLRSKPNNRLARLLLYGESRPATGSAGTAKPD